MKVDKFAAQAATDYARPNLFEISVDGMDIEAVAKAGSLPAATVGVVEVPYQNRKIKVPGDRTFADWTVTIINDESYAIRQLFLEWQKGIQEFDEWKGDTGPQAAHRTISVQPLTRTDKYTDHAWELMGWPSEVGAIDLSWESNDAVQEYTVTFSITWDNQE